MKHFEAVAKIIQLNHKDSSSDLHTTQLIFLKDFGCSLFPEYFEESSKHFETFLTVGQHFLDIQASGVNKLLDIFGGKVLETQIISKSWSKNNMAEHISNFFLSIGLISFSKLVVIISPSFRKDYSSLGRYFCQIANDREVRDLLKIHFNIHIPQETIFILACHDIEKGRLNISKGYALTSDHQTLLNYLGRKSECVMEKFHTYNSQDSVEVLRYSKNPITVIGRRLMTRGLFLNGDAFIQSYDHSVDPQCKQLLSLLETMIEVYMKTLVKPESKLKCQFLIEHFPSSLNGHLENFLSQEKNRIWTPHFKFASLHPETRHIEYYSQDSESTYDTLKSQNSIC